MPLARGYVPTDLRVERSRKKKKKKKKK